MCRRSIWRQLSYWTQTSASSLVWSYIDCLSSIDRSDSLWLQSSVLLSVSSLHLSLSYHQQIVQLARVSGLSSLVAKCCYYSWGISGYSSYAQVNWAISFFFWPILTSCVASPRPSPTASWREAVQFCTSWPAGVVFLSWWSEGLWAVAVSWFLELWALKSVTASLEIGLSIDSASKWFLPSNHSASSSTIATSEISCASVARFDAEQTLDGVKKKNSISALLRPNHESCSNSYA